MNRSGVVLAILLIGIIVSILPLTVQVYRLEARNDSLQSQLRDLQGRIQALESRRQVCHNITTVAYLVLNRTTEPKLYEHYGQSVLWNATTIDHYSSLGWYLISVPPLNVNDTLLWKLGLRFGQTETCK